MDEWESLLTRNRIWMLRNEGVGIIDRETAVSYGLTGPCLRGSGVAYDVRKDHPYFGYEQYDFDVPGGHARRRVRPLPGPPRGDPPERADRVQAVDRMPKGPILADAPKFVLPEKTRVLTGMEELIHQFMLVTGEMNPPKGEVVTTSRTRRAPTATTCAPRAARRRGGSRCARRAS